MASGCGTGHLTAPGRPPALVLSKDGPCKVLQWPHLWAGMEDTDGISVPLSNLLPLFFLITNLLPSPTSILLRT